MYFRSIKQWGYKPTDILGYKRQMDMYFKRTNHVAEMYGLDYQPYIPNTRIWSYRCA